MYFFFSILVLYFIYAKGVCYTGFFEKFKNRRGGSIQLP